MTLARGAFVGTGQDAPERLMAAVEQVADRTGETVPESAAGQGATELANAAVAGRPSVGG